MSKIKTKHTGEQCWIEACRHDRRPGKFTCEKHEKHEAEVNARLNANLTRSFNRIIFGRRR